MTKQTTPAALVLADGSVFEGTALGAAAPVTSGELVCNTAMSGYHEAITDPSYAGQLLAFTTSHVGNAGVNPDDDEAARPALRGLIVREFARCTSNQRATESLADMLCRHGISGIAGIDTRRLARTVRVNGALGAALGTASHAELLAAAKATSGTSGVDLVSEVTTTAPYSLGGHERTIVAYDFGITRTMAKRLAALGTVEVVPASTSAAAVLARNPAGVFLSSGPGDPASQPGAQEAIRELLGKVVIFGVGLGHQLLARAAGASTFKLPVGHYGANQPVRHLASGRIAITNQHHSFVVDPASLGTAVVETHRNLNDDTNAGIAVPGVRAYSVQFDPDDGPPGGQSLYDEFSALMEGTH
jgi:carbamoyl-phosphate synthase small subunit